ncbi:helix-turn-helix transcriptional regulator [Chitinophaga horti]|uniref:Helix-turn-helix transcriptional regulator n=1 Tax=Chitinophaga horti TaxID=2920382 RepID=A0ABY6J3S5_9BACT|nr:AraC family transcriptional regulator [Chitinophaga horti]UYQ92981.1 helix-turn-helix transcriptional regulator [Chitinophaga horti]
MPNPKAISEIPYQQLPLKGQFSVFDLGAFANELSRFPHTHETFEIIWFTKAKGQHVVDFVSYELEDDMLFFLRPGQVHQVLDSRREGHVIVFTEKFFFSNKHERDTQFDLTSLFDYSQAYAPVRIRPQAANAALGLIELMYAEAAITDPKYSRSILKNHLNAFLLLAEREKRSNLANTISEKTQFDNRVLQLRHILEQHFRKEHQAAFYADAVALTPKRLSEITKDAVGKTVTEMLHDRLVLEAKRQLAYSQRSVKEICYELGFEDPAYFSRFFRNHTGYSPHDFRDAMFK